ncbi:nicotinate-nucleotide adenylyltransferase [Pseudoalteromonas sp. SR43-6]|uniref:nicotinate-nucleotide adenylyltransferase n=1 Tax=Pseudoalteromonas TaxID=53246 RepID=UPI0015F7C3E7|nr:MULTISPECIES: nicotinate-nucleotide adenylyltransferase [Pseudoalteromonas]MBB1289193.1 nicotinate-nucleotide adenylyltransferase [Pseudoalteromonas sp. SR41-5]MBB1373609.1 nicotinate-nucleotide adenylyltransferase [Pseudoalteromonas sp. SR43-6]MBB1411902.1 nicotinate-nucleotide adenylyltransferase [Pseudoalteromonas sp. SG43-8]MBD0412026.1 nicotinate-nucleotide adenylyltransferase [Pseudoalteromonas distincta]
MIAIFGGTFDPVHLGHLNMAQQCVNAFNLVTLYFMPCALPAHKAAPGISTQHRINMLNAAIAPYPHFELDLRELNRAGPSYSLLSLQELRKEHPTTPILFLIGMDSFNNLDKWFEWKAITQLCHIVVYQRPAQHCIVKGELKSYMQRANASEVAALKHSLAGKLYFLPGEMLDAASSTIRKQLKKSNKKNELLPDAVSHYIEVHQLYQIDA